MFSGSWRSHELNGQSSSPGQGGLNQLSCRLMLRARQLGIPSQMVDRRLPFLASPWSPVTTHVPGFVGNLSEGDLFLSSKVSKAAVRGTAAFCLTLLDLERSEINALRSVAQTQVR